MKLIQSKINLRLSSQIVEFRESLRKYEVLYDCVEESLENTKKVMKELAPICIDLELIEMSAIPTKAQEQIEV